MRPRTIRGRKSRSARGPAEPPARPIRWAGVVAQAMAPAHCRVRAGLGAARNRGPISSGANLVPSPDRTHAGGHQSGLDLGPNSKVYGQVMSAMAVRPGGLRVGEIADAVGVGPDTIRYYERAGLLPKPPRTPGGYRTYDASAIDRLRFIQGAQRLGLHLRDIADLLAVRDTGVCPCEPAEVLLRRRLSDLDVEMARLAALRVQMVDMLEALPSAECPPPSPGTWCPTEERR